MRIRKKLNRASAHEDIESWPDMVTIHRFDLHATQKWCGRACDLGLMLVFAFVLVLSQIPEVGMILQESSETRIANTSIYVTGNSETGVKYMKKMFSSLGLTVQEKDARVGYRANVQKIVKQSACTKDNVRTVSVRLRTIIREKSGRPVHDLYSHVRTRLLSCTSDLYLAGLSDLIRDLIVQDELYYKHVLIDLPTQYGG